MGPFEEIKSRVRDSSNQWNLIEIEEMMRIEGEDEKEVEDGKGGEGPLLGGWYIS